MLSRRIIKKDIKFFGVTFLSRKVTKQYNSLHSLQRQSELVGARCELVAAPNATESVNDLGSGASFDEGTYTLEVAVATAYDSYISNNALGIDINAHQARAHALRLIIYVHRIVGGIV